MGIALISASVRAERDLTFLIFPAINLPDNPFAFVKVLVGEFALGFVMRIEASIGNTISSRDTCSIVAMMQRADEFTEARSINKAQGQPLLVDQVTNEVVERTLFDAVASPDDLVQGAVGYFGRAA